MVLPQGQFDAFLKGEPKERRKILVALLGLGVYERMQQLANQKSTAARTEAEFIRRQLETDFASATQETLEQERAELKAAETCARQAEASLQSLAEAATLAHQARTSRKDQASLAKDHASETKRLEAAQATLAGGGQARRALDDELEKLEAQKEAHGFDEARYTALVASKPRAEQLVILDKGREKATKAVADKRRDLDEARNAVAQEDRALPGWRRPKPTREKRSAAREPRRTRRTASTPPLPSARASRNPATPAPSAPSP